MSTTRDQFSTTHVASISPRRVKRHIFLSIGSGVVACSLLFPSFAHGQSNLVFLVSAPGDYVGGQTYYTTNPTAAPIETWGKAPFWGAIQVSAFGFIMDFSAPDRTVPGVGVYSNAMLFPDNGPPFNSENAPGLSVSGGGRGCSAVCGSFEILELHQDDNGNIDHFWATFLQYCECSQSSFTGEIRYNSQLAPPAPLPRTLHVPADYASIQAALDSVNQLTINTVLVAPGLYNESVQFGGKRALLISAAGPASTFIQAPQGSAAVVFSGSTPDSTLCGFTLTNSSTGVTVSSGGSPTIVSNSIVNCDDGISCGIGSPVLEYNSIIGCSGAAVQLGNTVAPLLMGNVLENNGSGIITYTSDPLIQNNLIRKNHGDGISMSEYADANIVQNVIVENDGNGVTWETVEGTRGPWLVNNTIAANGGAGISSVNLGGNLVMNNIVVGNPAISGGNYGTPGLQFNDVYSSTGLAYLETTNVTGINGNISTDPFFSCQTNSDYHLFSASSCIDAGTNLAGLLPSTDFDGRPRTQSGPTNGSAIVDLGAYEFDPLAPGIPCLFLNCPSNMAVVAPAGQNSTVVNYPAFSVTPWAVLSNSPPSGSVLPAGDYAVSVTAAYASNAISCVFEVTVLTTNDFGRALTATNIT